MSGQETWYPVFFGATATLRSVSLFFALAGFILTKYGRTAQVNEHVTDKRLKSHGMSSLEPRPSSLSLRHNMWYLGQHLNIARTQNQKTTCVPSSSVTSSDNVQSHNKIRMQQPKTGPTSYSTVGQSRLSNLLLLLMLHVLHLEINACAVNIPQPPS